MAIITIRGNLNITAVIMMEIQVITTMAPPVISTAIVTMRKTTRTGTIGSLTLN
ncbi:MAG: hypothetical protein WC828_07255 [Thermoleophilia bacterium]|jgi:hypothetical protein